ncbi:hypothetical protein L3X38_032739 [Prunus dulcis]|uniref:Uncharacterized protein n=1 Tax=Prunus dulcis TaxID=3755 RepID=A0AAD4VGB6_PRUDU|nr:hypothetical protein L3X38_032739 [Prunus dulcis]
MAAGGGRSSSLNFGLNSVGFLHFPASTGGSGGWDWSGWKEEDGTVLLGSVPPQVVAGCGGGGPKTAAFMERYFKRKFSSTTSSLDNVGSLSSRDVGISRNVVGNSKESELQDVSANLPADLGLRPQMLDYDLNIRDELR